MVALELCARGQPTDQIPCCFVEAHGAAPTGVKKPRNDCDRGPFKGFFHTGRGINFFDAKKFPSAYWCVEFFEDPASVISRDIGIARTYVCGFGLFFCPPACAHPATQAARVNPSASTPAEGQLNLGWSRGLHEQTPTRGGGVPVAAAPGSNDCCGVCFGDCVGYRAPVMAPRQGGPGRRDCAGSPVYRDLRCLRYRARRC